MNFLKKVSRKRNTSKAGAGGESGRDDSTNSAHFTTDHHAATANDNSLHLNTEHATQSLPAKLDTVATEDPPRDVLEQALRDFYLIHDSGKLDSLDTIIDTVYKNGLVWLDNGLMHKYGTCTGLSGIEPPSHVSKNPPAPEHGAALASAVAAAQSTPGQASGPPPPPPPQAKTPPPPPPEESKIPEHFRPKQDFSNVIAACNASEEGAAAQEDAPQDNGTEASSPPATPPRPVSAAAMVPPSPPGTLLYKDLKSALHSKGLSNYLELLHGSNINTFEDMRRLDPDDRQDPLWANMNYLDRKKMKVLVTQAKEVTKGLPDATLAAADGDADTDEDEYADNILAHEVEKHQQSSPPPDETPKPSSFRLPPHPVIPPREALLRKKNSSEDRPYSLPASFMGRHSGIGDIPPQNDVPPPRPQRKDVPAPPPKASPQEQTQETSGSSPVDGQDADASGDATEDDAANEALTEKEDEKVAEKPSSAPPSPKFSSPMAAYALLAAERMKAKRQEKVAAQQSAPEGGHQEESPPVEQPGAVPGEEALDQGEPVDVTDHKEPNLAASSALASAAVEIANVKRAEATTDGAIEKAPIGDDEPPAGDDQDPTNDDDNTGVSNIKSGDPGVANETADGENELANVANESSGFEIENVETPTKAEEEKSTNKPRADASDSWKAKDTVGEDERTAEDPPAVSGELLDAVARAEVKAADLEVARALLGKQKVVVKGLQRQVDAMEASFRELLGNLYVAVQEEQQQAGLIQAEETRLREELKGIDRLVVDQETKQDQEQPARDSKVMETSAVSVDETTTQVGGKQQAGASDSDDSDEGEQADGESSKAPPAESTPSTPIESTQAPEVEPTQTTQVEPTPIAEERDTAGDESQEEPASPKVVQVDSDEEVVVDATTEIAEQGAPVNDNTDDEEEAEAATCEGFVLDKASRFGTCTCGLPRFKHPESSGRSISVSGLPEKQDDPVVKGDSPCGRFQLDMSASTFNTCKCGFSKSDHVEGAGAQAKSGQESPSKVNRFKQMARGNSLKAPGSFRAKTT